MWDLALRLVFASTKQVGLPITAKRSLKYAVGRATLTQSRALALAALRFSVQTIQYSPDLAMRLNLLALHLYRPVLRLVQQIHLQGLR